MKLLTPIIALIATISASAQNQPAQACVIYSPPMQSSYAPNGNPIVGLDGRTMPLLLGAFGSSPSYEGLGTQVSVPPSVFGLFLRNSRSNLTMRIDDYWKATDMPAASLVADHLQHDRFLVQLQGNVEIRTAGMILQADEANYYAATGEIKASGNLHIKLIPAATK